jgi:sucrose phosphorylase
MGLKGNIMILNKVQLITYADSLGGNLAKLRENLAVNFPSLFLTLHILPPFPSSGDRGFAPLTYREIEKSFGTWDDMDTLGKEYCIMVDVMINHISKASEPFQNFLKLGKSSPYADYFLTLDKIWPLGEPRPEDLNKIYLRRKVPYSEYTAGNGKTVRVWTTFGAEDPSEQIDLDVNSPAVQKMLEETFALFHRHGIGLVRLDAVGYVIKKMRTSCFLVEPEFHELLGLLKRMAADHEIELLCEIHTDTETQKKIADDGFWIYDFMLPYTVLHTLINQSSDLLYRVLKNRPYNQFTTLDCHDGVPVKPDLDGWVDWNEVRKVCDICEERGARFTRIISEEHKGAGGFDVHQICGSYYSLLGDDDAYIAARAIQFFVPGIPQVYYVGLLAGENDEERRIQSGDNRELNRHNFSSEEIAEAVKKPVVQRLIRLIKFRNEHPAFNGNFFVEAAGEHRVDLQWRKDAEYCSLHIDLNARKGKISYTEAGNTKSYNI